MDRHVIEFGMDHDLAFSGSEKTLAPGFIDYNAPGSPAPFYTALVTARSEQGAAQNAASAFIAGEAPYGDSFVASFKQLPAPIHDFPKIAALYCQPAGDAVAWRDGLREAIRVLLAEYGMVVSYFSDPAYLADIDRLWLSYFALVALPGYNRQLLAEIALALWLAHAIAATVDRPDREPSALTPAQLSSLMYATIVLPSEIFPLAPAE